MACAHPRQLSLEKLNKIRLRWCVVALMRMYGNYVFTHVEQLRDA